MNAETPLALSALDDLMQGLKDGDEESADRARRVLIEMAESSSAKQLWILLLPVRCLMEREIRV